MNDLCEMCGESESGQVLCRTDNPKECWFLCDECVRNLLDDPDLAPMWCHVADGQPAAIVIRVGKERPTTSRNLQGERESQRRARGPFLN